MSDKILKGVKAHFSPYNLEEFNLQIVKEGKEVSLVDPKRVPHGEELFTPLRPEEVERLKREAYQEGFSKGYEEGKRLGFEEGFREGFSEGEKRGYEEGKVKAQSELEEEKARLNDLLKVELARLKSIIEKLDQEARDLIINLDEEILSLAMLIAEKILFTRPKVDKEVLINLIRECLFFVAEGLKVKIRINPMDFALLREHLDELPPTYQLEFEEDSSLTPGGVILSSATGIIDATVERRIKEVLSRLRMDEGKRDYFPS